MIDAHHFSGYLVWIGIICVVHCNRGVRRPMRCARWRATGSRVQFWRILSPVMWSAWPTRWVDFPKLSRHKKSVGDDQCLYPCALPAAWNGTWQISFAERNAWHSPLPSSDDRSSVRRDNLDPVWSERLKFHPPLGHAVGFLNITYL